MGTYKYAAFPFYLYNFFRLFFLSKREVLALLSETRDPTLVQKYVSHIFPGIQSLEFDDLHDAHAMISSKGERIPFSSPISTKEAKGCVEKWMLKVSITFFDSQFLNRKDNVY